MSNKHLYPDELLFRFKPYLQAKDIDSNLSIPLSPSGKPQDISPTDKGIIALNQSMSRLLSTVIKPKIIGDQTSNPNRSDDYLAELAKVGRTTLLPNYAPLDKALPPEFDKEKSRLDAKSVAFFIGTLHLPLDNKDITKYIKAYGFRAVYVCLERMTALKFANPTLVESDPVAYLESLLANTEETAKWVDEKINTYREQERQRRESTTPLHRTSAPDEQSKKSIMPPLAQEFASMEDISPNMSALLLSYQTLSESQKEVFRKIVKSRAQGLITYVVLPSPQSDTELSSFEVDKALGKPYDETLRYFFHDVMFAVLCSAMNEVNDMPEDVICDDMPVIPQSYYDEINAKEPIYTDYDDADLEDTP